MKRAVTVHVSGFDVQTAGVVIFIVGLVALGLAILYTFLWSREERYDTTVRRPQGGAPPAI